VEKKKGRERNQRKALGGGGLKEISYALDNPGRGKRRRGRTEGKLKKLRDVLHHRVTGGLGTRLRQITQKKKIATRRAAAGPDWAYHDAQKGKVARKGIYIRPPADDP